MEYSNYVEARTFVSGALTGAEKMAGSKDGDPMGWTTQQIADLAGTEEMSLASVSTAGATITLQCGFAHQRRFYGSAPFSTPKNVLLIGANVNHFTLFVELTSVAATLTFEAGFKSGDERYNLPSALIWTSNEIGIFKVTGDYNGTSWILEFSTLPAV